MLSHTRISTHIATPISEGSGASAGDYAAHPGLETGSGTASWIGFGGVRFAELGTRFGTRFRQPLGGARSAHVRVMIDGPEGPARTVVCIWISLRSEGLPTRPRGRDSAVRGPGRGYRVCARNALGAHYSTNPASRPGVSGGTAVAPRSAARPRTREGGIRRTREQHVRAPGSSCRH